MGWDTQVDSLSMQRQAGPGSSLGAWGARGGLPPCGRSQGPRGEMRPRHAEPRGRETRGREGGDERGPGDGAGKVLGCPPPPFPLFPCLHPVLQVLTETSGNFPFSSFHLPVHRPQGAAVHFSNPALCIQVLGCPGGVQAPNAGVLRGASAQDRGATCAMAPEKSCPLQPRSRL